jgi:hypothetical protein
MTFPTDFIQNGMQFTVGADGQTVKVTKLNPQQLATDESMVTLLAWLTENIPEGNPWTQLDAHAGYASPNNAFNCPSWQAVAANGQQFSGGQLFFSIFNYENPSPQILDELHTLASAPKP